MPATKPEHVDELFTQAMNDGDVDAVLALYEPDAILVAHTGESLTDQAARRAYLTPFLQAGLKIALDTAKIVRRGDLALVYSPWTASATNPDGTPLSMAGNSAVVLHCGSDGNWRFAIDDPGWIAG